MRRPKISMRIASVAMANNAPPLVAADCTADAVSSPLIEKGSSSNAFDELPFSISGEETASAVQSAATSGGALFAIATLAILMLIFGRRIVRSTVDQIDEPIVRVRVKRLLKTAYEMSSRYAYLMAARAVVVGFVAYGVAAVLGLDAPTAIAVWFAVMSLLPGFGLVLAALPLVAYEAVTA